MPTERIGVKYEHIYVRIGIKYPTREGHIASGFHIGQVKSGTKVCFLQNIRHHIYISVDDFQKITVKISTNWNSNH